MNTLPGILPDFLARSWRCIVTVALLAALDMAFTLPIVGATYRPFGWMYLDSSGLGSLYPVIQNVSFQKADLSFWVEVQTNSPCTLERNANLLNAGGWTNVMSATPTNQWFYLHDTNPPAKAAFYRLKQVLGTTP